MKAAVWYNTRDVRVVEVEEPKVEDGTVKIEVEWCGICGSDLHEYAAGPMTIPVGKPHPLTGQVAPVILGHEFSGRVVETGKGVSHVREGDRVVVEPILRCGHCYPCQRGYYNLCEKRGFHGITSDGGGFSEYTVVPAHLVYQLPDEVPFEAGAIVEPASVALYAVRKSSLKAGDTCAVFGAGPIGLLIIQAAKAAGARTIVAAVEISEKRLAKAAELGATHLVNPQKEDPVDVIRKITHHGADVSFEAAGVEQSFIQSIQCLKPDGEMILVSLWEQNISFHPNFLVMEERKILSIAAFRNIMPEVISLIASGRINAEGLITKKISLDDIVEEGFNTLLNDKSHSKILVSPKL
jgi:(R,R)-butanediol dehydrogenase/meso-butanediol dehydrogenase/diacetyl reductase